ncbi:hypothetical protein [Aeromicrobium duanguangcaii]|uniref:Monooxygenase n=1 Tax=Aeromicrobium duanguangcaii TaxID=2968086 RepID=A0ABY5KC34_9ACTN|nr:hypothetical protein [Aeromicrobium duanguangcaii]MCD9154706.1 hypothetical protein [Aeromicrobium duanguangcaii]UUI67880.1 hypothetical protein NP095_11810 [Aeromicrobium duanguangcaii]
MYGLSVRWSLADAPSGTLERLSEYVEAESHAKFSGLPGLHFKTWRARAGEWFEGTYVFVSDEARAQFQADFETRAADAPATAMTGAAPRIEPFEVVAVASGPDGFRSAARFEG